VKTLHIRNKDTGAVTVTVVLDRGGTDYEVHEATLGPGDELQYVEGVGFTTLGGLGARPTARVTHNADQAITTATPTALAFNTESFDTDGMHDNSTNNERLTFQTAGKWIIGGNVTWENVAAGEYRQAAIRLNGSTTIAEVMGPETVTAGHLRQSVVTLYEMSVGDYVELVVQHDRGSNLNLRSQGSQSPIFWATLAA
jgi:hypothetical protein